MVTAIGRIERAPDLSRRDDWLDPAAPDDSGLMLPPSELDRLLARGSALDRLVADAGPLGKFRVDMDNALPSGTSALTVRTDDSLVRALSLVDFSGDDLLAATPQNAPPAAVQPAQPEGNDDAAPPPLDRLQDPRPAIGSQAIFTDDDRRSATLDVHLPDSQGRWT